MTFIDFNTRKRLQIWEGISGPVFHSDKATLGHFTIEAGVNLPAHSHPHEQWTNMIEGELEFIIGEETTMMKPGMTAYIPSDVVHSGRAITQCKVIDCFIPAREDFKELEKKTQ